jgi:hypothetical protein
MQSNTVAVENPHISLPNLSVENQKGESDLRSGTYIATTSCGRTASCVCDSSE